MSLDSGRRAAGLRLGGTYYHPQFQAHAVKVLLGRHAISDRPDVMMVTTLGSCVAACVHDPAAGVGGMNHFLLPDVPQSDAGSVDDAARYGAVAMEWLVNAVLLRGGRRSRLEVKVFGAARVIASSADVGRRNADFVRTYVEREGLRLVGEDLGGNRARRIHFFPHSGRALRRLLRPEALPQTVSREMHFLSDLSASPIEGEVELFAED
ncbi:chemotaxis protein [Azospirillum halopraeferens]|uniref:chemotaxis protein n=1 Tax=Azospirillum halopraeferens TaxID=34010 RepID=UPI0003FB9670|nr:chemotaxis protein [Azospirillum halopraeferens]